MPDFQEKPITQFIKALSKEWWSLMSCAVFTIIGLYSAIRNKSNTWVVVASFVAAVLLFCVAAYRTWKHEYDAKIEALGKHYKERPLLILEVTRHDGSISFWNGVIARNERIFNIQNYGERAARFITIKPIPSALGNLTLCFSQIDVLPVTGSCTVRFEVLEKNGRSSSSTEIFLQFLRDHPPDAEKLYFDTAITYRDMDDKEVTNPVKMECECRLLKLRIMPPQPIQQESRHDS